MDWYVNWQDGVAVILGIAGLAAARWLHRRAATPHGCGRCPMLAKPVAGAAESGKTGAPKRN